MHNPEVIIVPVVFAIPAIVLLAKMSFRHKEKMASLQAGPERRADFEDRLERIEQAVDTIAIELERIGEGQRFVTKLLAEGAGKLPEGSAPAASVRVKTPH